MEIVFIRHGEPDRSGVAERGYMGQGYELAPLSHTGEEQARAAADSPLLSGCELIVSSPYTRALQTAAIISRKTDIPLTGELDLHELIPEKEFRNTGEAMFNELFSDMIRNKGEYPPGETRSWETMTQIIARTQPVLNSYVDKGYGKIAVVAHGGVMRRYVGIANIPHCGIYPVEYTKDFKCFGWI